MDKPIENLTRQTKFSSLWFTPAILLGAFIIVSLAVLWIIQTKTYVTKRNQLVDNSESSAESIRLRLNGNRDYLLLLAKERSEGTMNQKLFQERASRFVADHPELINITWVDADFVVHDVAPLASNKQILGLRIELPEPKRASHLVAERRQPVYTEPFETIQGDSSFEIWVPVFHEDNFLGLFAGVYSCKKVLQELISNQRLQNNQVSIVDALGRVLEELPATRTVDENLIHRVSLTLPGHEVFLQFKGYGPGVLEQSLLLLELLCLVFVIGMAYAMYGLKREIEVRKRAEEALYEAQQVFRALIENSPDIIARYDRDCQRTYVNPMYLKVAQIPQQELLASSPLQHSPLPAASARVLQNLLRKVLNSGVVDTIDVIWPKEDNIDYWYNISAFPEFDREGRVVSVMTVSRDITERKRVEEEIRTLNQELEQRVKDRTSELAAKNEELEKMNSVFVGRELRMIELKQKIEELERKNRG